MNSIAVKRASVIVWLLAGPIACVFAQSATTSAAEAPEYTREQLIEMSKRVQKQVEEIRGWEFKHPVQTDVYDEGRLRRFIERRVFEEELGGGKLEQMQAVLRMTGLIPRDCDVRKTIMDVLLNQIGGFYDPPTRSFYMLQRAGVKYGKLLNHVLVAHELCHALDDQYLDLQKLMKAHEPTEDASLAIGAVVEGSATQLMTVYMAREMASGDFDNDELTRAIQDEMARSQVFAEAPRYFSAIMANYICGMFFVVHGDLTLLQATDEAAGKRMQARMQRLARDLPTTAEQILHPEKYWNPAERDEPVRIDDAAMQGRLEQAGRFVVHKNTLGELNCCLLTTDPAQPFNLMAASLPSTWTNDAAKGWGGDRFFLLARGTDATIAAKDLKGLQGVWITAWDTADDRDEFVHDYESLRPDDRRVQVLIGDRAAAFLFGLEKAEASALAESLKTSPPQWTKDGRPWSADAATP